MATTQQIIPGDCIEGMRTLPDASVHCCVTSPPYWNLRDYKHDGQIGLESTPEAYVARMVEVFREVRRILREDGVLFLNLGDTYASGKQLVGIPWRVAFALQADGWWLRQDIIWHKPNPMVESVTDRCTKAHEYVFLLTKSERYFYDAEAVSEAASQSSGWAKQRNNGVNTWKYNASAERIAATGQRASDTQGFGSEGRRNRRSVWTISTKPYRGAHFAVMPPDLVEPCIKAGCPEQCCSSCGKGWERVVEKGKPVSASSENRFATNKKRDEAYCRNDGGTLGNMNGRIWAEHKAANPDKFLGWQPACECAATGTINGTVLDPFAGSGTTLAVAAEQGRNAIGCELNAEYIALAKKRIREARESVALFDGIS
jgi:DNA modification methylase